MEWQPSRPPAAAPQVVALNVGETVGERGTCNLSQRRAAHARMRDAGTAAFARERQPRFLIITRNTESESGDREFAELYT